MAVSPLEKLNLRIKGRYQRTVSQLFHRKPLKFAISGPIISFTFDDFPRSALYVGGDILGRFGAKGTYYASFGLMGTKVPTGEIFIAEDLPVLLRQGHELGCHTFDHCHSWETDPETFKESIDRNSRALRLFQSKCSFTSFSYPITQPHPAVKVKASERYRLCRGGGQTHNAGVVDLGLVRSYFLEKCKEDFGQIKRVIDENRQDNGWLIFSTHDICESPTTYGCTSSFFEQVVRYAAESGAKVLAASEALNRIVATGLR